MDGNDIRQSRRRLGLTQSQLAERLDVEQGTVSRWERGLERPRPVTQARLQTLLMRDDERRHWQRCLAIVRHDLSPATILEKRLIFSAMSASAASFFRSRGQDPTALDRMSLDRYLDKTGLSELFTYIKQSGLLTGDAFLFRFTVNFRGSGNTTVWEPIFEDGRFEGVLCYVSAVLAFPENTEFTLERVDFVPVDDPTKLVVLYEGPRAHLIGMTN